ncbi:hypothetical protein [Agromyces archimandritae]|uniref:Uncharacterized protein n=1 Tax=Agromyces archimandritae TaxID=2781962 RepID=A0A975IMG8_9MICO|nr:hypothetical protein [Agromyces archimandritae]QTX03473.1 hypothetical protein G127AT_08875 [Agromyces archimandritae]
MTETRTTDRIAELQRLAYGQETGDEERQLALAELASLARVDAAGGAPVPAVDAEGDVRVSAMDAEGDAPVSAMDAGGDARARAVDAAGSADRAAMDAVRTASAVREAAPWSAELPVVGAAASAPDVAGAADGDPHPESPGVALAAALPGVALPAVGTPPGTVEPPVDPPARPAGRRWALTALVGVAALVLGGIGGWQVRDAGAQAELAEPARAASAGDYGSFDDTPAADIFERPAADADILPPQFRQMLSGGDGNPASSEALVSRLLATRSDGTTVYASLLPDDSICLTAALVTGSSGGSCAQIGDFMKQGIVLGLSGGSGPSIDLSFGPDGVLRMAGAD